MGVAGGVGWGVGLTTTTRGKSGSAANVRRGVIGCCGGSFAAVVIDIVVVTLDVGVGSGDRGPSEIVSRLMSSMTLPIRARVLDDGPAVKGLVLVVHHSDGLAYRACGQCCSCG